MKIRFRKPWWTDRCYECGHTSREWQWPIHIFRPRPSGLPGFYSQEMARLDAAVGGFLNYRIQERVAALATWVDGPITYGPPKWWDFWIPQEQDS